MKQKEWEEFKRNAIRNRMLVRASKFKKLNSKQKKEVRDVIEYDREKVSRLYKVQKTLNYMGASFVIIKSFSHFPDMGNDFDILIEGDVKKAADALVKGFNGRILSSSMASNLAGKVSVRIEGEEVSRLRGLSIEFHKNSFSQIGEFSLSARQVIERGGLVEIYGKRFRVPSIEDEILIAVIHRIYRHMSVRFTDVYNVRKIMDEEEKDWNYLKKNIERMGIYKGFTYFLKLARIYGKDIESMDSFPRFVSKGDFLDFHSAKMLNDLTYFRVKSFLKMATVYPLLLVLQASVGKYMEGVFW